MVKQTTKLGRRSIRGIIGVAAGKPRRGIKFSEEDLKVLRGSARVVLAILAVAGAVALAVVAPNLIAALGQLGRVGGRNAGSYKKSDPQAGATRALYYLKDHGYIKMRRTKGEWKVALTTLGFKKSMSLKLDSIRIPMLKQWPGTWWQVAADIPTKEHRQGADLLRKKLKDMGFYPLQRTLWFYPHDPRKEIEFICRHYGVAHYVTVMEVLRLDLDDAKKMKRHFKKLKIL